MTTNSSPKIVISGSGLWTPSNIITNEELVESYNAYAEKFNSDHAAEIAAGKIEEKHLSSERFIEKTSGIKARHVYSREGILDIDRIVVGDAFVYLLLNIQYSALSSLSGPQNRLTKDIF